MAPGTGVRVRRERAGSIIAPDLKPDRALCKSEPWAFARMGCAAWVVPPGGAAACAVAVKGVIDGQFYQSAPDKC
eukprot:gene6073-6147_t